MALELNGTTGVSLVQDGVISTADLADSVNSGVAKAWVNFNGTGTVAIRRGFNVSSITDSGTGLYNVNFTTAMTDADYSTVANASVKATASSTAHVITLGDPDGTFGPYTTAAVNVRCFNAQDLTHSDPLILSVAVFS